VRSTTAKPQKRGERREEEEEEKGKMNEKEEEEEEGRKFRFVFQIPPRQGSNSVQCPMSNGRWALTDSSTQSTSHWQQLAQNFSSSVIPNTPNTHTTHGARPLFITA
jgi:hypothetical protein